MDDGISGIAGFIVFVFSVVMLIWFGRRMDSIARDSKRSADALEIIARKSDPDILDHERLKEIRRRQDLAGRSAR